MELFDDGPEGDSDGEDAYTGVSRVAGWDGPDSHRGAAHGAPTRASAVLLPRELVVLQLAAQRHSGHEIATIVRLRPPAVEELLRRCLWRLGAVDLRAAIALARRRGLIE